MILHVLLKLEKLRVKVAANGKRQIQVNNSSKKKMTDKKLPKTILLDKTGVKLLIFVQK